MNIEGGELIKLCRKQAGLSVDILARKTGINKGMLCRYERGETMPRYDKVVWCLKACGYELDLIRVKEKR